MIDGRHELVKLAALIDWEVFVREWAGFFPSHKGRPATETRVAFQGSARTDDSTPRLHGRGHRPCQSATLPTRPAGGQSHRPAPAPPTAGAGLCFSRACRSAGDRRAGAGETPCVSSSRPTGRQHSHGFRGRGDGPCPDAQGARRHKDFPPCGQPAPAVGAFSARRKAPLSPGRRCATPRPPPSRRRRLSRPSRRDTASDTGPTLGRHR